MKQRARDLDDVTGPRRTHRHPLVREVPPGSLTVPEVAEATALSRVAVERQIREGNLAVVQVEEHYTAQRWATPEAIEEWLKPV